MMSKGDATFEDLLDDRSQLGGRIGMRSVAQHHVEQQHSDLRVGRLLAQARQA